MGEDITAVYASDGPGAVIGCWSAGVARSCRTFGKTAAVVITAKSAGRKVFGLATAGVRLA